MLLKLTQSSPWWLHRGVASLPDQAAMVPGVFWPPHGGSYHEVVAACNFFQKKKKKFYNLF